MTLQLPSGWQKLWYHRPSMRQRAEIFDPNGGKGGYQLARREFDPSCFVYKGGQAKIQYLYGGLLTENAVQGLARGLLCAAIDRLERASMPVVLTVHDEAVCEVDEGNADLKLFEEVMSEPTRWAREMRIPIAVEAWEGSRYRK